MTKRFLSIILVISLVLSMTTTVFGNSAYDFWVELNNTEAFLEEEVYLNEKGQILYPLRKLAEALGYGLTWKGEDQKILLAKGNESIQLQIGEPVLQVNGENLELATAPVIKDHKTFVPLEFFSRALDLVVGLEPKRPTIKIRQATENTEEYFQASGDQELGHKLNTYLEALQERQNFHGSVLVAKDGRILLNKGYGFADFQQNTLNKSQTKFAIGSITKQFTAMGIMQLSEKGLLSVEDQVSKYIPHLPAGDMVTIHHLLTHTSGLPNFTDFIEFFYLSQYSNDPAIVLEIIKDKPLLFNPGESFSYSNTNYLLLGMIIEEVSGQSYEDYLKENILDVLHMKDTGASYGKENKAHDATAYIGYLDVVPVDDELLLRHAHGAGNMYSTVEDLYRWDRALKTGGLVKEETLDKMLTEYALFPGLGAYGYGWMISETDFGKMIWHNGATLGFTANLARYLDEDLTVIILTNRRQYDTSTLTKTLASIVFHEDYEMPEVIEEITLDPGLYASYVGQYDMGSGIYISIMEKDQQLYAQVTGQEAFEIFPQTENRFFARIVDVRIEFIKDEQGEVTGLVLEQMGISFPAQKQKIH